MLFHRQLCSSNSHWCAFLISRNLSITRPYLFCEKQVFPFPKRSLGFKTVTSTCGSSRPQEIFQPPQQGFFSVRTCPVAASRKDRSATVKLYCHMITVGTCTKLVVRLENHIASGYFQSFSWELCTAVNLLGIKIHVLCLMYSLFGISLDP
jgi:hypothetical protein